MSGRILVIDDVAANRALIRAKLTSVYYDVIVTGDAEEVGGILRHSPPAMVLIDVMMPEIDAFELCAELKNSSATAHIPVVMMSSSNDPDDRVRGLAAGADDFLIKPIHDLALFARVRNLMRVRFAMDELRHRNDVARDLGLPVDDLTKAPAIGPGQSVLVAAPDARQGQACCDSLSSRLGVVASFCTTEGDALSLAESRQPDAVLVHQALSANGDGLRCAAALSRNYATRNIAVIVAVNDDNMRTAAKALDLGAWDYVMEPCDPSELSMRMKSQLRRRLYSMRLRDNLTDGLRLASIDPLTGLYNRRFCSFRLGQMLESSAPAGRCVTAMVLDLDHFKRINDTYGHDAGDELLRSVARLIQQQVRGVDLTVRLGGEEFLVALPDTCVDGARPVAERVRSAIANTKFDIGTGQSINCTVSIGMAATTGAELSAERLIGQADEMLYLAKAQGRNRVVTSALESVKSKTA
ncbi:diguanylate cyclase [Pontivivens insulae]|uniref:diguanylate cyclase n=1 Tax=Pontivivens insulae TaxID=1639689 RepID=A0A2R8ACL4_9RHOB|nr:diguanylate cyclase [Pontivivens insulae]RED11047.1 response regulator receiver modulated diguanylate cyclase [Pontivivens insulae]SPF29778.1 Response regulator PleD [Pontivivens insulae]